MDLEEAATIKRVSITEARSTLPNLVREAEGGMTIEILRRGKPIAVILGRGEAEPPRSRRRSFSEAYDALRRVFDFDEVGIEPEEFLEGVRDRTPGRDVSL